MDDRYEGRSPHGERGLKYYACHPDSHIKMSLPSRGAWIEIVDVTVPVVTDPRRSPHGERGLKLE